MFQSLPNPTILILLLTAILLIIIFLYLRRSKSKNQPQDKGEQILEETQQKAYQILHQAIKKAQATLAIAELEGIKLVAGSKLSTGKLDQQYSDKLSQSIQAVQETLAKEMSEVEKAIFSAQGQFTQFIQDLQKRSQQLEETTAKAGQQMIHQAFAGLETRLSDFLVKTEQGTTTSIELELKSARQLIETYKTQQLQLIDENIIAMMEQTLNLVLAKKLSLKDQLDLVYEALEKAKVEKFIV